MTADPTLRIETCTSMHELASLAPAIDELNASSRRPSPFSTFAFLSTHVAHDDVPIDGVRASFEGGWGLVRASNTQPVLVMRCEAATAERLAEIRGAIEQHIANATASLNTLS